MNYELAKQLKDAGFPQKQPLWSNDMVIELDSDKITINDDLV